MLKQLHALGQAGMLREIDVEFAAFLARWETRPELLLCAALLSRELGQGHVCLDLGRVGERVAEWPLAAANLAAEHLQSAWQGSPLIAESGPLRLRGPRLYLARYFHFEQQLAAWLRQAGAPLPTPELQPWLAQLFAPDWGRLLAAWHGRPTGSLHDFLSQWLDVVAFEALDLAAIQACLDGANHPDELAALANLIPPSVRLDWQAVAVATAASGRFTLISGGPGTGKTSTVTRLLALLVALGGETAPLIRLAAPTGKAAARLTESIGKAKGELTGRLPEALLAAIPVQASTLHRLLGSLPGSHGFRHHADNPLPLDVLVVDEASMVDLPMMARLLAALPPQARLILLGDKDQLASVEAGAVLGDICQFASQGLSPGQADWLQQVTGFSLAAHARAGGAPLRDRLCLLRKSWRFDARSGIGQLARVVNAGAVAELDGVLAAGFGDIALHPEASSEAVVRLAIQGYRLYLQRIRPGMPEDDIRLALQEFNRLRVLCAVREGPRGVSGLNRQIGEALANAGLLVAAGDWFAGRPVMISRNDHGLGLYNGDLGLAISDGERLRVWFEMPDGQLRGFLPSRLPEHETAWAMTVHKSQGSEFAHTLLVLPERPEPVLTRELIYTGITRARQRLDLFASRPVLVAGLRRITERNSGLPQALAAPAAADEVGRQG